MQRIPESRTASARRGFLATGVIAPTDGHTIDFVVEAGRNQLSEIIRRVRDGRE